MRSGPFNSELGKIFVDFAGLRRRGHGTRWYMETRTFRDGAPGIGLECKRWCSSLEVCIVGPDNFAAGRPRGISPLAPASHDGDRHPSTGGMTFEGLVEREAWVFAAVFAPAPIVGATGSPGNPIAVL